jgi:3-methyladenine DNA glycosylase Mpg
VSGIDEIRGTRIAWALRRRGLVAGTPEAAGVARRIEALPPVRLASGPGLVTVAFGITREDTRRDLLDPRSRLRLEAPAAADPEPEIQATARVGIAYAPEPWRSLPWRLVDRRSAALSGSPPPRAAGPG